MPDIHDIQRYLEHEESNPDGLVFTDPTSIKARRRIIKWLGRKLGAGNFAETCSNYFWSAVITSFFWAMVSFWWNRQILIFAGGIASIITLQLIWKYLKRVWPFRLLPSAFKTTF